MIVVNKYKSEYDVYGGRGSVWGNPFSNLPETKALYKTNSREESIEKYKPYLWHQMKEGFITHDMLRGLKGKRVSCYCKPKDCHLDVVAAAVEWVTRNDK